MAAMWRSNTVERRVQRRFPREARDAPRVVPEGEGLLDHPSPTMSAKDPALKFVMPTYGMRDVADCVDAYEQHFWQNGHDVRIVVCDRRHGGKSRQVLRADRTQSDIQPVYYVFDRAALSY